MLEPQQETKSRKWGKKSEVVQSFNCGVRCNNRVMSIECSVLSC